MGFLSTVTANIRKYADEPESDVKYTDAKLREFIRMAWTDVLSELNKVSKNKVRVRMDITIVADTYSYSLPPNIQEILMLEKIDSTSGRPEWEILPNHPLAPNGPGFTIEGPTIRFDPVWKRGETLRLTYVPNGEVEVYEGTISSGTSTTITLPATGTGTLDKRPQAYAGYTIRLGGGTYTGSLDIVQERIVASYANGTRVCTITPALDPVPTNFTGMTFELVPHFAYMCEHCIAMRVAMLIAATTKDDKRLVTLTREYHQMLRNLRMNLSHLNARTGSNMQRAVRGKRGRGS